MDSVVMDWVRIGLSASAFILVMKLLFMKLRIPGLSDVVASL